MSSILPNAELIDHFESSNVEIDLQSNDIEILFANVILLIKKAPL